LNRSLKFGIRNSGLRFIYYGGRIGSVRDMGVGFESAAEWTAWLAILALNFVPFCLPLCLFLFVELLSLIKGEMPGMKKAFRRCILCPTTVRMCMAFLLTGLQILDLYFVPAADNGQSFLRSRCSEFLIALGRSCCDDIIYNTGAEDLACFFVNPQEGIAWKSPNCCTRRLIGGQKDVK
jgi:hypothetical protein